MFKKIILILILSLIPTNSFAQENYDDVDWSSFDWDRIIPDQHTINLAKFYRELDDIKDSNPNMYLFFSNNFDENEKIKLQKYYFDATKFFGIDTSISYINDENSGPFTRRFLKNNGVDAQGFDEWMDKRQNSAAGAYVQQNNMLYHHIYFYINLKNSAEWVTPPEDYEATIYHEAAHIYFYNLVDRKNSQYMGPDKESNCWIFEGFANSFGVSAYTYVTGKEKKRNDWIKQLKVSMPEISHKNKENLINYFNKNKNNLSFCYEKSGAYTVGMLLIEYLYSNYDFNKINLLVKKIEERSNLYWKNNLKAKENIFEDLLKEILILDSNTFYSNFFDYLIYEYEKTID